MRNALLSLSLLICACSESPNRTEFANEQLALLQLHERVGALSAQLGGRPAMPDLAPLSDRVAALEAKMATLQAPKVPHLVVANLGDDLGIYLGEPARAWNVEAGGEVDWSRDRSLFFQSSDCTGTQWAAVEYFARPSSRIIGPMGRILKPAPGGDTSFPPGSVLGIDESKKVICVPLKGELPASVVRVEDAGIDARAYSPALLSIELR